MRLVTAAVISLSLWGCQPDGSSDVGTNPTTAPTTGVNATGVAVLGSGSHSASNVNMEVITGNGDKIREPTDLGFHPDNSGELWVVNQSTESVTILFEAGDETQESSHRQELVSGPHFLARPAGIAFGRNTMATIHDTDEPTQGNATPWDFMGPTMWTIDTSIFDAGHPTHLDMLHNSPSGKGIAWERQNVYWVFDGQHESLTRYDFVDDHGLGGSDHSDAVVHRYADGKVKGVEGHVSHLEYDKDTDLLYVADSGKARIAVLDAGSGNEGDSYGPNYDGTTQRMVNGSDISKLVDWAELGWSAPNGLALYGDLIFVSDTDEGIIAAFTKDGVLEDWLDVGGSPAGLELNDSGELFYTDVNANEVIKVSPL